ncbi:beta-galactosidase [Paenibacillus sp. GYB004]|uniref:beta-galactosidase n=1 Tax=Paenibacillus sp. GYB004 TaxID=2994393 RepID=UPI002F968BD5
MKSTNPTNPSHHSTWTQGAGIPIGLWVSPPPQHISEERYREIKEAGFTFVIGLAEYGAGTEYIHKALDAAQANGLRYLVYDTRLFALSRGDLHKVGEIAGEFAGHPAFGGNLFIDEPSVAQYEHLTALKAAYSEAVPHGLAYVNLFPTYASDEQRGGVDHERYVELYMEQFRPDILSYDHYPFLTPRQGRELTITKDYFANLQLIRQAALRHNVPFWLFIQTLAFNRSNRDPSAAEIRWQVYTSLAFGAKGIQYFTYWTPDNGRETFGDAMIDRAGNRTRHYGEVQSVNREIAGLGGVLSTLESVGVMTHGNVQPPFGGTLTQFGPVRRLEGDAAIIGCFRNGGGHAYALVVNESFEAAHTINLWLSRPEEPVQVWQQGLQTELRPESGKLSVSLEPGEGKLVRFA